MKKTGLEIMLLMAKGEAPKKIKYGGFDWKYNRIYDNYVCNGCILDIFECFSEEFEIKENKIMKLKKLLKGE